MLALALVAVLAGCGEEEPKVIDVGTRITTAADALECATGAKVQTRTVPAAKRVSPDAASAVQLWAKRMRHSADVPLDGYLVAVEEVGTVLFTHSTDHRADIAVIATRTEDAKADLGWVVTSWARCRPGDPLS